MKKNPASRGFFMPFRVPQGPLFHLERVVWCRVDGLDNQHSGYRRSPRISWTLRAENYSINDQYRGILNAWMVGFLKSKRSLSFGVGIVEEPVAGHPPLSRVRTFRAGQNRTIYHNGTIQLKLIGSICVQRDTGVGEAFQCMGRSRNVAPFTCHFWGNRMIISVRLCVACITDGQQETKQKCRDRQAHGVRLQQVP